jgi:hypothetical protein
MVHSLLFRQSRIAVRMLVWSWLEEDCGLLVALGVLRLGSRGM